MRVAKFRIFLKVFLVNLFVLKIFFCGAHFVKIDSRMSIGITIIQHEFPGNDTFCDV